MCHFFYDFFYRKLSLLHILQHQEQGMLHQRNARRRNSIRLLLFSPGMWCMVCSNDVEVVVQERLPECIAMMRRFDGRITFDEVAVLPIIVCCEVQVMYADLGCNPLFG